MICCFPCFLTYGDCTNALLALIYGQIFFWAHFGLAFSQTSGKLVRLTLFDVSATRGELLVSFPDPTPKRRLPDVYQTLSSFWGWGLGTRVGELYELEP